MVYATKGSLTSRPDRSDDHLGDFFRAGLLHKMSAPLDGGVGLIGGTGHTPDKGFFAPRCHRIVIGKGTYERFFKGFEEIPGLPLLFQ